MKAPQRKISINITMIGFVYAKLFCFSIFTLSSNVIKMLLLPAQYSNTIGVPEFLTIHHIARISQWEERAKIEGGHKLIYIKDRIFGKKTVGILILT
jgi:hypothetical protein